MSTWEELDLMAECFSEVEDRRKQAHWEKKKHRASTRGGTGEDVAHATRQAQRARTMAKEARER